jgi:hypothetical protein
METPNHWFPAKRYGWGWGPPSTWQGWTVLAAYLALVLAGIPWIQFAWGGGPYLLYVLGLTVLLVAVCWLKGEPPRWRWGDRES